MINTDGVLGTHNAPSDNPAVHERTPTHTLPLSRVSTGLMTRTTYQKRRAENGDMSTRGSIPDTSEATSSPIMGAAVNPRCPLPKA